MRRRICSVGIAFILLWGGVSSHIAVAGEHCSTAAKSLTDNASEAELRGFIDTCPNHSGALNNLALVLENRGHLEEAQRFYERAVAADPSSVAPYAGLGDVLQAQGRMQEAAAAYRSFLSGLADLKQQSQTHPLLQYETLYRDRLGAIPILAQATGEVVGAERITRSLTSEPIRTRGLSLQSRSEPHIDLHIRFEFDSARLGPETGAQLDEIAKALKTDQLVTRHIVIEGHTDSTGTAAYNRKLSIRRSATVRLELMARGIAGHRLSALGFGETRPVADNASEDGQARNRRVTFVNMGER